MQIDFCKHIDPWCKYNPKLLACDGTHIGVSVWNVLLDHGGVTAVDEQDRIVKPKHKRYDRVLIDNRHAREHMEYLTRKVLKKTKEHEIFQEKRKTLRMPVSCK